MATRSPRSNASFGATGSKVYGTLSDAYIAGQVAKGLGRYISPDLQIDASTCQFPDNTWFVKGPRHSNWTNLEDGMMCAVLSADHEVTVKELSTTQFIVADNNSDDWAPMTKENCDTYHWDAAADPDAKVSFIERIRAYFRSLRTWLNSLKRILQNYFNKTEEPVSGNP